LLKLESPAVGLPLENLPRAIAGRTRLIYDRISFLYPASTFFFHSRAHRQAMAQCGIEDGMRVLEVATGSGEMFRRLVRKNQNGATLGVDLSPNMAARTQQRARNQFPMARAGCQAVDARFLPFPDEVFDAVVCCYMFELLASEDILAALCEIRRVLRTSGLLTVVLIGENTELFNRLYRLASAVAPAFWGRQVERSVPELVESIDFRITNDCAVRQSFYPSRVISARKLSRAARLQS
jgi:ubiquinone/menaquinone biosynthesis C-methylase UbiE